MPAGALTDAAPDLAPGLDGFRPWGPPPTGPLRAVRAGRSGLESRGSPGTSHRGPPAAPITQKNRAKPGMAVLCLTLKNRRFWATLREGNVGKTPEIHRRQQKSEGVTFPSFAFQRGSPVMQQII